MTNLTNLYTCTIFNVSNFTKGTGGDFLSFSNIPTIDVVANGSSTWFRLSDSIDGNSGFGTGDVLMVLNGTSGFTADNIGLNLASSNQARFLFA